MTYTIHGGPKFTYPKQPKIIHFGRNI